MIGKTMVTDHASTIKAIDATTPAETLTLTMASPTFKVRACVNAGLSACMHMHMHTHRAHSTARKLCVIPKACVTQLSPIHQVRVDKSKGDIGLSLTNNPSGVGVTVCADS